MSEIEYGPARVAPGMAPGGLVVHTYAAIGGELLAEHRVGLEGEPTLEAMERDARHVRDVAGVGAPLALVVYDGDTGERWGLDEYAQLAARVTRP